MAHALCAVDNALVRSPVAALACALTPGVGAAGAAGGGCGLSWGAPARCVRIRWGAHRVRVRRALLRPRLRRRVRRLARRCARHPARARRRRVRRGRRAHAPRVRRACAQHLAHVRPRAVRGGRPRRVARAAQLPHDGPHQHVPLCHGRRRLVDGRAPRGLHAHGWRARAGRRRRVVAQRRLQPPAPPVDPQWHRHRRLQPHARRLARVEHGPPRRPHHRRRRARRVWPGLVRRLRARAQHGRLQHRRPRHHRAQLLGAQ